jgi:hypothetical protein
MIFGAPSLTIIDAAEPLDAKEASGEFGSAFLYSRFVPVKSLFVTM